MSGFRQAGPRGPTCFSASVWDTHRGNCTPVRAISLRATWWKRASTKGSSKTIRTLGWTPWSWAGRLEE